VAEGKLDPLNLAVIRAGFARLQTLEAELETPFEFRRSGLLVLINNQTHWDAWAERANRLTAAGIPTEMLDRDALKAAEPHLDTSVYWGAAYAVEGWVNPFLFCRAYARAAQRHGAVILPGSPVEKIHRTGQKIVAVEAAGSRYSADTFAVMSGAWTRPVLQLAGIDLPVDFTHVQALITEPVALTIRHTIALANFYDLIHGKEQAVAVGFNRDTHGALIVTEAVEKITERHSKTHAWGLAGISAELLELFPGLANVNVVRSWGVPTPFTPDENPLIGWVPGRANLFVGAGFMQTISSVPIVSEWMARMILGQALPIDLIAYDPARFST
jgi:sarcosine oxidase subunit beta